MVGAIDLLPLPYKNRNCADEFGFENAKTDKLMAKFLHKLQTDWNQKLTLPPSLAGIV